METNQISHCVLNNQLNEIERNQISRHAWRAAPCVPRLRIRSKTDMDFKSHDITAGIALPCTPLIYPRRCGSDRSLHSGPCRPPPLAPGNCATRTCERALSGWDMRTSLELLGMPAKRTLWCRWGRAVELCSGRIKGKRMRSASQQIEESE